MNVATIRITRGPYRVARRLVRKLTKPVRLAMIRRQLATSENTVWALEGARIEAIELLQAEHRRQVQLMQKRRAVEGW